MQAPYHPSKNNDEELIEKVKKTLFIKGRTSSQIMNDVLKDLSLLAKPNCKTLQRNNDITPFEDANSLEFLGPKNDCGLFAFASHNKKRPNNLVLVSNALNTLSQVF
jgi:ribosome production factor 2